MFSETWRHMNAKAVDDVLPQVSSKYPKFRNCILPGTGALANKIAGRWWWEDPLHQDVCCKFIVSILPQAKQCVTQFIPINIVPCPEHQSCPLSLCFRKIDDSLEMEIIPPPSLCGFRTNDSGDSIADITMLSFSKLHSPAKHFRIFSMSVLLSRNLVRSSG